MAKHLSAVCREPHFISSSHACRENRRGTCQITGWKNSAESHIGFHVSNLCFLTSLLWQSEREKAKKWGKASGPSLFLCLFQVYKCVLVFSSISWLSDNNPSESINSHNEYIDIYFYSVIPHFPAVTFLLCRSGTFPKSDGLEEAPSPVTASRTQYSDIVPFCRWGC